MKKLENKVCAIIPVYNEEKYIYQVVKETLQFVNTVIVVDDGCTDNSIEKIQNLANVKIISHKYNFGKGKALRTGFENAIQSEFELILTLDGDLQHQPNEILKFVQKISDYDIVIGNRLHTLKTMPIHRRMSNFLTSFLLSKKIGTKILDSQSGFRIFRKSILQNILPTFSGFEAESEMLVKAGRQKALIGFVDIPTIYNDNQSKMKSIRAIIGFIRVLFI